MRLEALLPIMLAGCAGNGSGARAEAAAFRASWADRTWSEVARPVLGNQLGLRWTGEGWQMDTAWSGADDAASTAYFSQPILTAAIARAEARCDRKALAELAGFYVTAYGRFLSFSGARSLPWKPGVNETGRQVTDCFLCVSQFLYPAAKIIRVTAGIPASSRPSELAELATRYHALLVEDQVFRNAESVPFPMGEGGWVPGLTTAWERILRFPNTRRLSLRQYGLSDAQLWLLASAAELIEAHRLDPSLVPLAEDEVVRLKRFVAAGSARFRQSGTWHTEGGVETLDFFEGELASHEDYAYAGYQDAAFPRPGDTARVRTLAWDVSHATRIPTVLRSLKDAQQATGEDFPTDRELAAAARQLTRKVYYGDASHPLFRNYMDGSDGWYRVGYAGRGEWGYPPSWACENLTGRRPCLGSGVLPAWGALREWDSMLEEIAARQFRMASAADLGTIAFRDRYYQWNGVFAFADLQGRVPSLILYELVAQFEEQLPCAR